MELYEYIKTGQIAAAKEYVNNRSEYKECAFRIACANGHLDLAKWLLSTERTINVNANNDAAFRWACAGNHLEVAKWLNAINDDIDICALDNYVYRTTYAKNHYRTFKWLCQLCDSCDIMMENGVVTIRVERKSLTKELKKVTNEIKLNEPCAICMACDVDRINLNCLDKHTHCYCFDCLASLEEHKQLKKKCLLCMNTIVVGNCSLAKCCDVHC
jgi:ankyrin repeat protein